MKLRLGTRRALRAAGRNQPHPREIARLIDHALLEPDATWLAGLTAYYVTPSFGGTTPALGTAVVIYYLLATRLRRSGVDLDSHP